MHLLFYIDKMTTLEDPITKDDMYKDNIEHTTKKDVSEWIDADAWGLVVRQWLLLDDDHHVKCKMTHTLLLYAPFIHMYL